MAISGEFDQWQLSKSLSECNRYMLENTIAYDVSFQVGTTKQETIHAHKYVLLARSPVFFAMLCGGLKEKEGEATKVPDVEPESFKQMLMYMYTDSANLTSDTVLPTLYASKKYMIPPLTAECFKFLEDNLNADNVCLILEQSILYDEHSLTEKSKNFIENRTNEVFKSPTFKELTQSMLMSLLRYDCLTMTELEIFQGCCSWAESECERKAIAVTPDHKRQVLGDALFLIRFPTMSIKVFAKNVSKCGILTADERCAIFEYLATDQEERKPSEIAFPTVTRSMAEPLILQRYKQFYRSAVWSGDCSSLKLMVNKPIVIKGFRFAGSISYDPISEVQFTIKHNRDVLISCCIPVHDNQSGDTIEVLLTKAIKCKADDWYAINCTVHFSGENDQGYCLRGKGGSKTMLHDDVVFEFDRGDSGFILEIIFCK